MTTVVHPAAGLDVTEVTRSEASLRRFLHGLPGVDQVGAEARVASLGTRSIKTTAKEFALDLAIRMVDLTTLEGQDTPGKVRALSAKAMRPDPADPTCPQVAAVCVYPDMVATARETLGDSGVHVAAVATAFPSGRAAMDIKLADTRDAVEAGAGLIERREDPEGRLTLDAVRVETRHGCIALDTPRLAVEPGERVLILGKRGSGRTSFFLAIAGLWSAGSGRITVPPGTEVAYLTQRPFLPRGSLRAVLVPDGLAPSDDWV